MFVLPIPHQPRSAEQLDQPRIPTLAKTSFREPPYALMKRLVDLVGDQVLYQEWDAREAVPRATDRQPPAVLDRQLDE